MLPESNELQENGQYEQLLLILEEIPADSTAVGVPARVVKQGGVRVDKLDQIHIPDPVSQELCRMTLKIEQLQKELNEYKEKEKENENL